MNNTIKCWIALDWLNFFVSLILLDYWMQLNLIIRLDSIAFDGIERYPSDDFWKTIN